MKKIIILSLIALSTVTADAQRKRTRTATSQGNVVVRFGMGLNSHRSDPDGPTQWTSKSVSFNPSVSYMVIDNLEFGGTLNINNTTDENITWNTPVAKTLTKGTDIGFGVFAQKYIPMNNWFAFYVAGNLGVSTGNYNTDTYSGSLVTNAGKGNRNGVGGGVNFGFGFTPYNAFALWADIAGLGIQTMKDDPDGANNTTNTTDIGFNVNRQPISIGLAWYFGRGLWRK